MKRFFSPQFLGCCALVLTATFCCAAAASTDTQLGFELGGVWQARNDVQIPGPTGTRFALDEVIDSGPYGFFRLDYSWLWLERHGLRLVYAPLRISEPGELQQPVDFAGENFSAGTVNATYQFDAHRISYRYLALEQSHAGLYVGATLLVRDAEIHLEQNGLSSRDTNVGVVPLLHLAGYYSLSPHWQLSFDLDGLAAPQGRAIDLGVQANYQITPDWSLFTGYRLLDGGADNDEVYNFARFHYLTTGSRVRF